MATAVTACGGGGQVSTHAHHQHPDDGSQLSAPRQVAAAAGADGTATIASMVSPSSLPKGWTSCPATASHDAGAAAPHTRGCGFVRATEVQVQELLHNEGSTVFNTTESIGVDYAGRPQQLLNCTAQRNGPTIVCADNGVPRVIVFRPPGG